MRISTLLYIGIISSVFDGWMGCGDSGSIQTDATELSGEDGGSEIILDDFMEMDFEVSGLDEAGSGDEVGKEDESATADSQTMSDEPTGNDVAVLCTPPTPSIPESFAQNELSFIRAIVREYLRSGANFSEAINQKPANLNNYYRVMCSHVILSAIDQLCEGVEIVGTDPDIQRMVKDLQTDYPILIQDTTHVAPAPLFDCLIAASLVQQVLDPNLLDFLLQQTAIFLAHRFVWDKTDFSHYYYTVEFFKAIQSGNAGNTQAEEVGIAASLYTAAAKLIPVEKLIEIDPSFNAETPNLWLKRAAELTIYSVSQCEKECPFKTGKWLAANHQLDPSPTYTQSLLTSFGEIAAILHQLNSAATFPDTFFSETGYSSDTAIQLEDAIVGIAAALQSYTDSSFHFTGPFNHIQPDGTVVESGNYDCLHYTVTSEPNNYINSSIPIKGLDAFTQFLSPDQQTVKSYVYAGNTVWHYTCLWPSECRAQYQKTLSEYWSGLTNLESAGWNTYPPPSDRLDSFHAFMLPDQVTLKSYFTVADRIWHYVCTYDQGSFGNCSAVHTKALTEQWSAIQNQGGAGWDLVPPPQDGVDSLNSFFLPDQTTLKTYVTAGDRVWHYTCAYDGTNLGNCQAGYTKSLSEMWSALPGYDTWEVKPPNDRIDSLTQYFSPDNTLLKSYILANDRAWYYSCNFVGNTNTGCQAGYTKPLEQFWAVIKYQYKWPQNEEAGFYQYHGVSDWGFDAAIQNSAYAAMAAVSSSLAARYVLMQQEQCLRGLDQHPYFPPRLENSQWSFGDFIAVRPGPFLTYLTDGYLSIGGVDSHPPSLDLRVNSHWWVNMLAGYNHAMAYLLMTQQTLLQPFPAN